ncbi:Mak10 subunit, NatC N-terminal acetyltransferase-domain-containing protein [Thelonectria olida]|uniref:Mak10 subunit, NatC N-terminal acetyltransferase-domain-containing protein n=1 Tax=Thelonectria olida TaxID=1576542 RepID=A0A9P8WGA1_9HYPO|nr:Mak10 subunit, NatC N-terminal acetyltransferase-domain-containing protein [Thelonectria olida]
MADFGFGVPDDIARLSLGQEPDPPGPPPQTETSSAGVVAVDITEKFAEAVKTLKPGELVKDGFFTLFESVAALEIMDPKMDSGCVQSEEDLEESYDVSRPLTPEEVIGIIDQLLCHEMAWHLGYPLSQTLFTSVYVESLLMPTPRNIEEADFVRSKTDGTNRHPMLSVLRAYCLGMLKGCGFVNQRIRSEHFYEEEDFVTNTYNRKLLPDISTEAIQAVILQARVLLRSIGKELGHEMVKALDSRLELRYLFLNAIQCPEHMHEPEVARKPWKDAVAIIPDIGNSHKLGKDVDEAFSARLQRKLASTMPPRPIVQIGFEDAFGHLTRLFQDGSELIDVLNYTNSQALQTFVCTFQAKKPQPLVFVRTLLQTFLFNEMEILGSMSIRQIMDDDFSIVSLPANPRLDRANDEIEAVNDPRFVMSQQMELFRQRAAQPFLDVLRTFCQNRCRVRRTLCHIIRDWEALQVDAEEIDELIQNKTKEVPLRLRMNGTIIQTFSLPLSSWTYLYKLRLMEWIVQLGFELEVYQPDEYAGMYWYLNFLSDWREQHLKRLDTMIQQQLKEFAASPQQVDPAGKHQLERSLTFIALQRLDAAVTWRLSYSLSCLYAVLARLGLLKAPPRPLSSDELRYELRMRPFASIGLPALPTFEEFTTGTAQPEHPTPDLLDYAERAQVGAKEGFEQLSSRFTAETSFSTGSHDRWLLSTKNGLRSCIMTGIAISAVQKALQNSSATGELKIKAEVPIPDKCYHNWWVVPKIVPI